MHRRWQWNSHASCSLAKCARLSATWKHTSRASRSLRRARLAAHRRPRRPRRPPSKRCITMAQDTAKRAMIVVKRYKRGGGGHHGGAWKVAYADFVTAMMAFFLVMWLVAAVSKDQRAAIFDYFKNPSMEQGKSVKPAPGMAGPGGASTSPINLRGGLDAPRVLQSPTA